MTDLPPEKIIGIEITTDEPTRIQDIEWVVNTMQFTAWDIDNNGQIIIYTGLKFGPKGLEKWEEGNDGN